jgi:uncharacterized protein with FMN-binding domain
MSKSGDKKVGNSLVALSCAAVLAVYSAGYARTRAAASQFDAQSAERRPTPQGQTRAAAPELVVNATETVAAREVPVAGTRETAAPVSEAISAAVEAPAQTPVPAVENPVAAVVAPGPAPAPEPPPPPAPAPPPAPPAAPKWKDGTFTGWGTSRHGDIQAAVFIEDGKIQKATIAECNTRYSCDVIDMLPPQVAARQSADVDYVSRATESANAFYYAVVEALNKATPTK